MNDTVPVAVLPPCGTLAACASGWLDRRFRPRSGKPIGIPCRADVPHGKPGHHTRIGSCAKAPPGQQSTPDWPRHPGTAARQAPGAPATTCRSRSRQGSRPHAALWLRRPHRRFAKKKGRGPLTLPQPICPVRRRKCSIGHAPFTSPNTCLQIDADKEIVAHVSASRLIGPHEVIEQKIADGFRNRCLGFRETGDCLRAGF